MVFAAHELLVFRRMKRDEDNQQRQASGGKASRSVWLLGWWLLTATPLFLLAVMGWQRRWMSDDGFINLRVVRNILSGYGPVFNIGERVEAFTSSLWVALISTISALGAPLEISAVSGGIVCSVLGLGCAMLGSLLLYTDPEESLLDAVRRRWLVPAGAVTYAAVPVAWDYASSGLETGLSLLWLGASFASVSAYLRHISDKEASNTGSFGRRLRDAAGFAVGLGPLVRPELALFSVGWIGTILLTDHRSNRLNWRTFGRLGLAAGTIPVAYQLFRMGYYAALVPNTAFAKSAFGANWTQGLYFAENFFGMYLLAIPLILLGLGWLEALVRSAESAQFHRLVGLTVPVACGLLYTTYVIRIGGGFMHGRLLLPPFFGVCLPMMYFPLRWEASSGSRSLLWRRSFGVVAVAAWAVVCGAYFRVPEENQHGIGDERGWYSRQAGVKNPVKVEDYSDFHFYTSAKGLFERAQQRCPAVLGQRGENDSPAGEGACDRFVAVDGHGGADLVPSRREYPLAEHIGQRGIVFSALRVALGIKGMVLGQHAHLVDKVGLGDPVAARLELQRRGRPGHEKSLGKTWYIARMAAPTAQEDIRVTAARRAMQCGELGSLLQSVEGSLSVGGFLKNLYRSVALHGLTIPANPLDAYHRFCGGTPSFEKVVGGDGGNLRRWRCPLGWAVASVEASEAPKNDAIGSVRIQCRPVRVENGLAWEDGASLDGPRWGRPGSGRTELRCEGSSQFMVGLQGGADQLVRSMRGVCQSMSEGPASDRVPTEASIGDGGPSVAARCPDGEIMVGMKVRAGTMIDAMGVVCRPIDAIDAL
jgi:arabinofuranosyltransferase